LSHDEVKRVVGLFYGFVSVIASAPHCFLYLNNEYMIIKRKKKKKKRKKKSPLFPCVQVQALVDGPLIDPQKSL